MTTNSKDFTTTGGKHAAWWMHSSGVAKFFNNSVSSYFEIEKDDSSFLPGGGGVSKHEFSQFTSQMAADDFEKSPETWKPYKKEYNRMTRCDVITLL